MIGFIRSNKIKKKYYREDGAYFRRGIDVVRRNVLHINYGNRFSTGKIYSPDGEDWELKGVIVDGQDIDFFYVDLKMNGELFISWEIISL